MILIHQHKLSRWKWITKLADKLLIK
jgi:hypothetical protein